MEGDGNAADTPEPRNMGILRGVVLVLDLALDTQTPLIFSHPPLDPPSLTPPLL